MTHLKDANTTKGLFLKPLDNKAPPDSNEHELEADENAPKNHENKIVLTMQGLVFVGDHNQTSDYASHEQFIVDGLNRRILANIPFFKKYALMKVFKKWAAGNMYRRIREQALVQTLFVT